MWEQVKDYLEKRERQGTKQARMGPLPIRARSGEGYYWRVIIVKEVDPLGDAVLL